MKRNFVKLFVVFGILLCIFALFGCEFIEFEPETGEESRESISQTKETLPDDEEPSDEEESSEIETDETTGELTDSSFVPDEELIKALTKYLSEYYAEYDMPETSVAIKIDQIKNGAQPLQLKFNPDDYYFVCAYFETEHEYEDVDYCCVSEYTWVGFNSQEDITESYNGIKFLLAFQINKTEICRDLLPDDRIVPKTEHFMLYKPIFQDGKNCNIPKEYDGTFIYLNSSKKSSVYLCSNHPTHDWEAMRYVELDGKSYIPVYLYTTKPYEGYDKQIRWELGDYYDLLTKIMICDKYYEVSRNGSTMYYGLFEIEEFVNTIFH